MGPGPNDLNEDFVRSLPDEGPVVMVNLVRFREHSLDGLGSGWDADGRYSKADIPLLKRVGGTILWAGHVEGAALGPTGVLRCQARTCPISNPLKCRTSPGRKRSGHVREARCAVVSRNLYGQPRHIFPMEGRAARAVLPAVRSGAGAQRTGTTSA
jgi:hypothetical protein